MLPVIANENLADYIDVFCEEGFFSPEGNAADLRSGNAVRNEIKITRESIEQHWWR